MLCPYHKDAPRSLDGSAAWGLFRDFDYRIKTAGMGVVIGVEADAAIRQLAAFGTDIVIAEDLIAGCEQGFVAAMNEREDDGHED